jgi:hypothetical protein
MTGHRSEFCPNNQSQMSKKKRKKDPEVKVTGTKVTVLIQEIVPGHWK